jgi:hypothetical protein
MALPSIVVVVLLAAFFNLPDQAVTHGDFGVVERMVDGDPLLLASDEPGQWCSRWMLPETIVFAFCYDRVPPEGSPALPTNDD